MIHLPNLILDLAMILMVAGISILLCKKIKQPLVLGYIVAGFITGPNFHYFPTVADEASVQTWSEIGVIILLFALGLEFSFYKLKKVGSSAFITAFVVVLGMLSLGYFGGQMLGWSKTDSAFLGALISMSSTSVVFKSFEDLDLKKFEFTNLTFGVLIVEDIVGILMMVIISTLAVTSEISGVKLAYEIIRLAFYLVLWFVLGMYTIPKFYNGIKDLVNDEMLVVVSIGLCLAMVALAVNLGFSSALGAFLMGSLIAESVNASRIEKLIKPIKDLFGAIFFVSVGMLVEPSLLIKYIWPVTITFFMVVIGLILFSTIGVLLSGKRLKTAIKVGFSLAQIGEFSFIVATLGVQLGLISEFLYPIIVAVSVITTFTTPFFMKISDYAYEKLEKALPEKVVKHLEWYAKDDLDNQVTDNDWIVFFNSYFTRTMINTILIIAIYMICTLFILPTLNKELPNYINEIITMLICFVAAAPFLRAIVLNRTGKPELFTNLWFKNRTNHLPLLMLLFIKIFIAASFIYVVLSTFTVIHLLLKILIVVGLIYFISTSNWLLEEYVRFEADFLLNLNVKHVEKKRAKLKKDNGEVQEKWVDKEGGETLAGWMDEEYYVVTYKTISNSNFINKKLKDLDIRKTYGCNIIQVIEKNSSYSFPSGEFVIPNSSELVFLGRKRQLEVLERSMNSSGYLLRTSEKITLREFILSKDGKEESFYTIAISVNKNSPLVNKSMREFNFRKEWYCLVLGLERNGYAITEPHIYLKFDKNDIVWILGQQNMLKKLLKDEII